MKILMYLLYGDNNQLWQEAKFSILTAWRFINQKASEFKIVVCTDRPEQINGYPVTVQHFDAQQLKDWAGPSMYFHRAKNRVMAEVMDKYSSPTVFVDSDTYFKKSPALLFARIRPGSTVMHQSEGLVVKKHSQLAHHLQELILSDPNGGTYTFSPKAEMWNSGIVGLHPTDRPLLERAQWLVDELYWRTKIFNVEQFGLTEVLKAETRLRPAADVLVHYWGFPRPFFRQTLRHFFEERSDAPFDTLVADSVHYKADVAKNPLSERATIHLKGRLSGWSSLYKAACLAVLSGIRSKKADTSDEAVQAIWRQYALTWLEEELVICEKNFQAGRLSAPQLRNKLEHWRKDKELAPVREANDLAKFSESEHKKWLEFWDRVNKCLANMDAES